MISLHKDSIYMFTQLLAEPLFAIFLLYMSSNSCTVKSVNDLKSNGFLDNFHKIAKNGHSIYELVIIKLFSINYDRDLLYILCSIVPHYIYYFLQQYIIKQLISHIK
jgi:hypothetical protein